MQTKSKAKTLTNTTDETLLTVPVIFGTAGHIDHGKSSLIRALTGTDPDRLKEEKKRGITIELGFAFLNDSIAFIDVPGHEKFIKHMVAGAATIDYAILIVAADDGIMPQTREHLDIINLLGVSGGMVVITKTALVDDDEWLIMVKDDIETLVKGTILEGSPVLQVDSLSGHGLELVRQEILTLATKKRVMGGRGVFRLPIDRVFTIKGFGTVVTGSVLSGTLKSGDILEVLPSQLEVRAKGIQSQGSKMTTAIAGQRAAINLHNVAVSEINRGDVLVSSGSLKPTKWIDAKITLLKSSPVPLKHRQRIRLHIACAEILARVSLLDKTEILPGESGFVQFILEKPTATQRLDRYIIRRYSPQITMGGGMIIDANPLPHRRNKAEVVKSLKNLISGDGSGLVITALNKNPFSDIKALAVQLSLPEEDLQSTLDDLLLDGKLLVFQLAKRNIYCTQELFQSVFELMVKELKQFHLKNPLRAGMRQGDLQPRIKNKKHIKQAPMMLIERAIAAGLLIRPGGDLLALVTFKVELSKNQQAQIEQINHLLSKGQFKPPSVAELANSTSQKVSELQTLLDYMVDTDQLVCLEGSLYFKSDALLTAKTMLVQMYEQKESYTLSEIRERLETSRKYAVPLLNHFDALGYTRRDADLRFAGLKLLK